MEILQEMLEIVCEENAKANTNLVELKFAKLSRLENILKILKLKMKFSASR